MLYSYKNTILVVVFTFARDAVNIDKFRNLYEPVFKKVIFYAQLPTNEIERIDGIHYLDIKNGWYVTRIFEHFNITYQSELSNIDGLFYTMDDNIININILKFYNPNKIIYHYESGKWGDHGVMKNVKDHSGWHWSSGYQACINNLFNDPDYNKLKYGTNVRGQLGDYCYLPKKYLKHAFSLFKIFSKHDIMLEITIPTVIRLIEPDETKYNMFKSIELWGGYRDVMGCKDTIYELFVNQLNLCIHPIKFGQIPDAFDWLNTIFSKKFDKCVVITTINGITDAIQKHIDSDYDVIVVGDKKPMTMYL